MKKLLIVALLISSLFIVLPAHAQDSVDFNLGDFVFLSANAQSCGFVHFPDSYIGISGNGKTVLDFIITDGDGNSLRNSFPITFSSFPYDNYSMLSYPLSQKPTANPIRVQVIRDGVLIYDKAADNPCLPSTGTSLTDNAGPAFQFGTDGRINKDQAQAVAVYCRSNGDIEVLSPTGQQLLYATVEQIEAVGTPAVNTLIEAGSNNWRLYRLAGGSFQLNGPFHATGREYVVNWDACPAKEVVTSIY